MFVGPGWDFFYTPQYSHKGNPLVFIFRLLLSSAGLQPSPSMRKKNSGDNGKVDRMIMKINKLVAAKQPNTAVKKLIDGGIIAKLFEQNV